MNLSQIKSDALAATQGEWKLPKDRTDEMMLPDMFDPEEWERTHTLTSGVWSSSADFPICWTFGDYDPEFGEQDAAAIARHIANMDPPTTIALVEEVERLREALVHIAEYWNGSQTPGAMSDALAEILDTAIQTLGSEREPTAEERLRMKDERIAELEAKLAARQALGEDNES